ncbi:efflux RND transporter permease subunit [Iodobacter sp. HSC-16F04]|uniref:Efflux RND transporter permease subunit n=1 Tax=Iodobacter violaceini TaxID=3044271 RepID=A0ABX0KLL3_9NEIS|nr:efflux RND transporter permease subunit [Iodobacter violacea]NHQ84775.1 efflux RND transporter permease subunit [Iodobacter violacea]
MNFSAWSIRNPIPAIMLFVLLSLAGVLSFQSMKVQDFPDIELPMVTVTAIQPGAAPAQLESEVARKLENSVSALQGVKHVYSKIQDGTVMLTVEFVLEKPTNEAVEDVRNAISGVRGDLPSDLKDPIIGKVEFSSVPFLVFTVASGTLGEEALSWLVDNKISKEIRSVSGVGKFSRVGGINREIRVEIDPARLAALNVSAAEVSRSLAQTQRDSSGGRSDLIGSEQAIRTLSTVQSAGELGQMTLPLNDGRSIRLDQVATITDTTAERRSIALLDGKPVVGFEISRSRGASEIEVAAGIHAALAKIKAANAGLTITEAYNMAEPVQESFDGSMKLLWEGALLAVLVVWWFLRDWRATLVSAAALPLSILPAFIGMAYLGFSLNTVTLLSLALVVGILVDDAIVEIENIVRHLRMGKSPYQAAMEAADEIGLAVIATTFALVAVFLPTAFMAGVPGKFFKQFGWTAALAVMASLIVARLLTPMMAAYLLKPITHEHKDGRMMQGYLKLAHWCLRHRKLTTVFSLLFFIGSLMLVPLLPTGFIPPDDRSQTLVKIELPPGATLEETSSVAERARLLLASEKSVIRIYTAIGGGGAGADPFAAGITEVNKANLTLTLSGRTERDKKIIIESRLRDLLKDIPGVRLSVGLGGSGEKFQLILLGDDPATLVATAQNVERDMRTIQGVGAVTSSASLVRPEVSIRPDLARAADLGVSISSISDTIRISTVGDFDTQVAKLNLPERQIPIVVRLPDSTRKDLEQIKLLKVPGKNGDVMLSEVASVELSSGPSQIDRYDRARDVIFDIELSGRSLGDVSAEVDKLPSLLQLPKGVERAAFGDAEEMKKLFASFGIAMLTGVLCIYMVLVLLFKDFMQPVTILAALPLSIGGAFLALLIAQSSFSMPTLIGLIMLMGIATKNSILLVEYAIVARRDGMSRFDALMDAGLKRARPIVMTTIAMGAGMLPIALGIGIDPSFRSPMAIAVIGGLITSTLLSLLVVPVVFTFVDDFVQWLSKHRKGKAGASPAES